MFVAAVRVGSPISNQLELENEHSNRTINDRCG